MREVLSLVSSGGGGGAVVFNNNEAASDKTEDVANNNSSGSCSSTAGGDSSGYLSGSDSDSGAAGAGAGAGGGREDGSTPAPAAPAVKMLSSQPGYLELSEERVRELLSDRPIEELYEVEDQPFARGKYATVRRCRCRRTGQQFAAKVVRKRRRSADLRAEILHEVAVLDACRACPRIVRLHSVFESHSDMVLLLELAAGGELQMVLDRDEVPEEREVARLMRQILHGLIYLHDMNVAHLDLKPQNLVLTGDFPDCDVKLCDFGISRYLGEGADVREILGTPDYVAPEVLNYEPISLATDMWSVGVLLYVLLTGCSPFGGETKQETFCNISQCRLDFPDDLFEDVSDNAKDLMRKLIVKDPKRRLSASECLRHHWFAAQESVAASPSPVTARRHSVAAPPCAPCASPKPPPPLPATPPPASAAASPPSPPASPPASPRRVAPADSLDSRRPLPGLDRSQSAHAVLSMSSPRRLAAADSLDSLDRLPGAQSTPRTGISALRRDTFLRNMESIAKRLSVAGDADTDTGAEAGAGAGPARAEEAGGQQRPRASVRASARAMQTMPVRRAFQVTSLSHAAAAAGQRASGLTGLAGLATSAVDLRSDMTAKEKEVVFKFRKVFVLEDEDLDALSHLPASSMSPPPSINGSTGSSVYSDTSISDSNSDTVSELSVDSSSDRSSIISLDHDDQYPWDMAYARLGLSPLGLSPLGRLYHPGYNVWERARPHQGPGGGGGSTRLYPRECKGSFARALSRFATEDKPEDRSRMGPGPSGGCSAGAGGGGGRPILNKLALMQTAMNRGKRCGLELMREKNGNLVVIREIREVKPGGRYARFSEVKCESVQSRIRKLQVQGAKS